MTPYLNPQIKVKGEQIVDLTDYSWKQVSWSGDGSVNGTITVNRDIRDKLVSFEFVSTTNAFHYAYCTFYSSGRNNYLITTMYGNTKHPIVSSMSATTFNLTLDWANGIKLNRIYVFDK